MNAAAKPPLLGWYDERRRTLPWREHPSPYRTWISEIMLQQTQVSTATPYFLRFTRRWPDARSLARAKEEDVLREWAGLGYYSRARNLLRAAKAIVLDHEGAVPSDIESLRKLPGIGRYTAAAISSIAYGRPHAVLDGNVARVLARLHALRADLQKPAAQKKLWALAEAALDPARPGDWNQAMMELGARVCLPPPAAPLCGDCPLHLSCRSRALGLTEKIPAIRKRQAVLRVPMKLLLIKGPKGILLRHRSAEEKILPGHWGLPEQRHLPQVHPGALLKTLRHSITNHDIRIQVRAGSWPDKMPLPRPARWISQRSLKKKLIASLWLKAFGFRLPPG
ncbi:MAG: A/G-specific adenine glycosylase [Elusimicrobiota bacterium]